MERDTQNIGLQRRAARAAEIASVAMADFADSHISHAQGMAMQSGRERAAILNLAESSLTSQTQSFGSAQRQITDNFEARSKSALHEAVVKGKLTDKTKIRNAEQTLENNISQVLQARFEGERLVGINKTEATRALRSTLSDDDRIVNHTSESVKSSALMSGELVRRITAVDSKIKQLELIIDSRQDRFRQLSESKRRQLADIIQGRTTNLSRLSETKLDQFFRLIDRLVADEQRASSNSRNRSHNNRSGDSSSRTNFRAPESQGQDSDPRIDILRGKTSGEDVRPYIIVLRNIDHHRNAGKSDADIYRLLMRHFHPDTSDHTDAEALSRILSGSYNPKTKEFRF